MGRASFSSLVALIWLRHSLKSGILLFLLSQVVLKIIKHYQEEGQGSEVVQGVLLGLVVDDRLEITNCFPFPQHTEDDADFDEGNREQRLLSVCSSILSCCYTNGHKSCK